jgi:hypothetical protein
MSKKYSGHSGGEKCFSLDIPFNRTSLLSPMVQVAEAIVAQAR